MPRGHSPTLQRSRLITHAAAAAAVAAVAAAAAAVAAAMPVHGARSNHTATTSDPASWDRELQTGAGVCDGVAVKMQQADAGTTGLSPGTATAGPVAEPAV